MNENINFKFTPELYDKQINWENRFKTEKDFFYSIFIGKNVKRVLDVGCGTARHAQLFSSFVDEVYAMDPSEDMIEFARKEVVKSENIVLLKGGFKGLGKLNLGKFDAITCLGNTLPLLGNRKNVKSALKNTKKKLKKNGFAVFQFLNFEKKMIEKNRYYKPKILLHNDKKYIFHKHFEYGKVKTKTDFIITVLNKRDEIEVFNVESSIMCTLKIRIFEKMAINSGFKKIYYYGNDGKSIFNKNKHISLFAILYT
jgi:ubiquinone/menaquinone biosynthesis C-methylase UbiE